MLTRLARPLALGWGCGLILALSLLARTAWAQAAPAFERVDAAPCRALALDQEPYWAALGDEAVVVQDKRGLHREALPEALRQPQQTLEVFFGRDYRVRVVGTARTARGEELRYYRSLPGGLRPALDELGPLGKAGAPGLVAVLGTLDPEIVCRAGASCLIKRVTGWQKASAPPGLLRVGLSLGHGWALTATGLLRLDTDWVSVGAGGAAPSFRQPESAFLRGEKACVVERGPGLLHHFDGSRWRSAASPISGPRSLWGSDTSLWVAGDGGAAYNESGTWQRAPSAPASVAQVLGRGAEDVWLCAASGVFRAKAR